MISIETIDNEARLLALVPEWERLAESISPRLPFHTPLWCVTWWRHFKRDSLAAADSLRVYVMRDETQALVALAPMMLSRRPGKGPVCTRELQFFGADPYVTELRGVICKSERYAEALRALDAHIERHDDHDWVQWRGVPAAHVSEIAGDHFAVEPKNATIDYFLRVPGDWDAFRSGLSRNIKESLRKCYNSLARDGHAFKLNVVEAASDAPAALESFFALHRTRAEKSGTVDHNNVFDGERERQFLRDYCIALAHRGGLRIFQLTIKDRIVATRVGFLFGDELYLYFSGYDVAWSQYSVMTTTVAEAIKWAIERGCAIVNLSTGTDVSKTRWRPEQIDYAGGYSVAANPLSKLAFRMVAQRRNAAA